jgi:hypothetical protein
MRLKTIMTMIAPTAVAEFLAAVRKCLKGESLIDEKAHRDGINNGHRGGFGGRHDAAVDAT